VIELRAVPWNHPDSERLRADQQAEIALRYGTPDSEPGPKPSATDISVFFVAYDGDEAVGCGGLRTLDEKHGEIKRMYVVPGRRGSGVASAILRHLEVEARSRAWDRLVLETGDEQPDAVRFYEREGYTRIPNFGYYADSELSICFEKRF
jgi:putative acetyltransferase